LKSNNQAIDPIPIFNYIPFYDLNRPELKAQQYIPIVLHVLDKGRQGIHKTRNPQHEVQEKLAALNELKRVLCGRNEQL
jgi:chromosome condensin MukBEF ATPase and DNA-binding subunit MukB